MTTMLRLPCQASGERIILGAEYEAEITVFGIVHDGPGQPSVRLDIRTSIDVQVVPHPTGVPVTGPPLGDQNANGVRLVRSVHLHRDETVAIGPFIRVRAIEVSHGGQVQLGFQAYKRNQGIPINQESRYSQMASLVIRAQETFPLGSVLYYRRNGHFARAVSTGRGTFRVVSNNQPGANVGSKPPKHQHVFVWVNEVQTCAGSPEEEDWSELPRDQHELVQIEQLRPQLSDILAAQHPPEQRPGSNG